LKKNTSTLGSQPLSIIQTTFSLKLTTHRITCSTYSTKENSYWPLLNSKTKHIILKWIFFVVKLCIAISPPHLICIW